MDHVAAFDRIAVFFVLHVFYITDSHRTAEYDDRVAAYVQIFVCPERVDLSQSLWCL
jgi:hypothetical protein